MEHLSEQAKEVLERYRGARAPTSGDEATAFERLRGGVREEDASALIAEQGRRRRRRKRRLLWRAIRPAVVASVLGAAVYGAIRYSDHMGETALLNDVKVLMEQGDHGLALSKLVEHSRRFNTRRAAERRMGLVVDCLCALDKPQRAKEELERYLELNPESIHGDRIADVCPGIEMPDAPEPTEEFPKPRLRDESLTVVLPPQVEHVPAEPEASQPERESTATTEARRFDRGEVVQPGKAERGFHWSTIDP